MSGALRTTFLFLLAAITLLALAAYYYPWTTAESAGQLVGEALVEDYKTSKVHNIEVSEFAESIKRIKLKLKGSDSWTIPQKNNFIADRVEQTTDAINCLLNLNIYEVVSEQQQDHQTYGVVDPDDTGSTQAMAGVGSKIILSDRNGQTIAGLIVGKSEDEASQSAEIKTGKQKHFVRIPGQPNIYLVDFDKSVLTTRFSDWVDLNLLRLRESGGDQQISQIKMENSKIDPAALTDSTPAKIEKKLLFSFDIRVLGRNMNIESLNVPDKENKIENLVKTAKPRMSMNVFQQMMAPVLNFPLVDATPQPSTVAKALGNIANEKFDVASISDDDTKKFNEAGFLINDDNSIDGTNGTNTIGTSSNIKLHVVLGGIAPFKSKTGLTQYCLCYATIDPEKIPTKPDPIDESTATEEEKRVFRRDQQKYESTLNRATNLANEFNDRFAPWFYVIDEQAAQSMRPALDRLFVPSSLKPTADNPENKTPADGKTKPDKSKTKEDKSSDKTTNKEKPKNEKKSP